MPRWKVVWVQGNGEVVQGSRERESLWRQWQEQKIQSEVEASLGNRFVSGQVWLAIVGKVDSDSPAKEFELAQ